MFKTEETGDKIGEAVAILLTALTKQCAAINNYATSALNSTVQGIWECSVRRPVIDSLIGYEDGWATFGANLSPGLETDLIVLYNRIMPFLPENVDLKDVVYRLSAHAIFYYGDGKEGAEALRHLRDVYMTNSYLLVMRLFELLTATQLLEIGIPPINRDG